MEKWMMAGIVWHICFLIGRTYAMENNKSAMIGWYLVAAGWFGVMLYTK